MKLMYTFILLGFYCSLQAQTSIKGQLQDEKNAAIGFANVVLYQQSDSSIAKVEITDEAGIFKMPQVTPGSYFLVASFVGYNDYRQADIRLNSGQQIDLGVLKLMPASIQLQEATVTASRAMVEVKPDRTVFNVQGTINSVGSDAVELLRKAPGVTVDNNDNINVLGRSGVIVYVDGKRLPLGGQDLANYLKSLTADQVDRIDIITNPGAKYEAEGNAGIIDIKLKKDENLGANGSVNLTGSKGQYAMGNGTISSNYRNKFLNVFATLGAAKGENFNDLIFYSLQNGLILDESNINRNSWENVNYRVGTDFFLHKNHTIGFLVSGFEGTGAHSNTNRISIAQQVAPDAIDSILVAQNERDDQRDQQTYNFNYRFDNSKGKTLNLDLDHGSYGFVSNRYQPNRYYNATEQLLLSENIDVFDTDTKIDISTLKLDYEQEVLGGNLGIGSKLSRVVSDNLFLVFDELNGEVIQNDTFSNSFKYVENVYAAYVSFARPLGEKWNFSAGLRAEQTDANGDLKAFLEELQEAPVELNYLSWFPSLGLTWQLATQHSLALNYGRRINRPDYNVLNPFNNRLSILSYEKGNPRLNPEIVNNIELGWTYAYRYNFKIGYSRTIDQITRLLAPDEVDDRANFITWANLASQTIWSANASLPFQVRKGWNAYFNLSASHIDNQAEYPDGGVVDVQAFTYNFYTQQTIDLPAGFKGEISGWYSGPGVWGGVFLYESSWSLNLGLQKKLFQDKMNLRLSMNDLFYESGWDGYSEFNGLYSEGGGRWDSRRLSLSLGYNFGNQKVKVRKRETGLEEEAGRVGG
ncbi:MAG TPA: TonB-dependent receptor [Saprospiraceae bacterium]|nr:TonB-dependent receptor [Saprospiraceae bacterium]HMQ84166.1 TonB-dependent receptor [Saprospiraceae bacterium]